MGKPAKAAKRRHSIEQDTPLIPGIVADGVVQEVALALEPRRDGLGPEALAFLDGAGPQRAMSDALAERAERTYKANAEFARGMHRADCRERLESFMRHWAAAEVKAALGAAAYAALPEGFAMGREPPPAGAAPRP